MKKYKRLFIDSVSSDFNINEDIVLGPWCLLSQFSLEEIKNFQRKNIFSIDEFGLNTPGRGVLEGITRQTVLDLAKELNLPFNLKPLSLQKLKSSKEVFATSTAGGIMPITKINGQKIGTGIPGNKTRLLHKIYWDKHTNPTWSTAVEDLL